MQVTIFLDHAKVKGRHHVINVEPKGRYLCIFAEIQRPAETHTISFHGSYPELQEFVDEMTAAMARLRAELEAMAVAALQDSTADLERAAVEAMADGEAAAAGDSQDNDS